MKTIFQLFILFCGWVINLARQQQKRPSGDDQRRRWRWWRK